MANLTDWADKSATIGSISASLNMVSSMARAQKSTQMAHTQELSKMIKCMDWEDTPKKMEVSMKDFGLKTNWKELNSGNCEKFN